MTGIEFLRHQVLVVLNQVLYGTTLDGMRWHVVLYRTNRTEAIQKQTYNESL